MLKWFALATTVAFASPGAQAATLTGDTITQVDPSGTHSVLVGSGVDLTEGHISFDYNTGPAGNEFVISISNGPFGGVYNIFGTSTITLSNLVFSGGEVLSNFVVISSQLPMTVDILSQSSFSLTWSETVVNTGIFLHGGFLTSSPVPTPLPAAFPLFVTGLGGLGLLGWRRKRKAQAAN